jgi:tetratricopeptide (TPR) repeat protein/O-antigen ligase
MQRLVEWIEVPRVDRTKLATLAGLVALMYFVLLGEAGQRDLSPVIRVINAVAAGTLILTYLLVAPRRADRADRGVLLALLLFAAAAVLADFPRQALDALLGALLYAAAFFVGRSLLGLEDGRTAFISCLVVLSAIFTFFTASRWLLSAIEWWSLTNWTVFPPLSMEFAAVPWGHRHDLTLLIVMLYPSWWLGRVSPLRAAMATVTGVLTLLIVFLDGSRNLWLAIGVASAVLGVIFGMRQFRADRTRTLGALVALAVGVAALAVTGVLGLVVERAFNTASVGFRWAMWGPLTEAWMSDPIAGSGPGSFPWVLQLTDYFQTNSFAPRHPDSAIFQLLVEGGLLGLASVIVLLATLLPAIYRGRSRAALWALTVFGLAGLAANPTDFGFLVAIAIGWAAFAVPRTPEPWEASDAGVPAEPARTRRASRMITLALFGIVAVGWSATAVADLSYGLARSAIASGRMTEAEERLRLAMSLDPGLALYPRQLGALQLLLDRPALALQSLERAVAANPSDDLAWRVLALASETSGDLEAAGAALERSLQTQRSDPTNLLVAASSTRGSDEDEAHVELLAEIVQAWPEIVAAPGWAEFLPPAVETRDLVNRALDRWLGGAPSPEPDHLQSLALAVMAGRTDLAEELATETLGPSLGAVYVSVMDCRSDAAMLLDKASDADRRSNLYWLLAVRQAALDDRVDERALRILEIMSGAPFPPSGGLAALNPLDENGYGYSADLWGYRRVPIFWPDYRMLPSVESGVARWYLEPRSAIRGAQLETVMTRCR